ncbi:unnamed protein product [Ectocarpus sp. 13 AM-2016]
MRGALVCRTFLRGREGQSRCGNHSSGTCTDDQYRRVLVHNLPQTVPTIGIHCTTVSTGNIHTLHAGDNNHTLLVFTVKTVPISLYPVPSYVRTDLTLDVVDSRGRRLALERYTQINWPRGVRKSIEIKHRYSGVLHSL